jgi:hypothetical protein
VSLRHAIRLKHRPTSTCCSLPFYVTADDLLPDRPQNARRSVTDAEVIALCVAQAIMGIPSDRRFLAVASKHLRHLFPRIPGQAGYFKRRRRLADTMEWLMGVFASQSPGFYDDLLLIDSTPGGVRPQPRDGQAIRAWGRRGLWVLRQSFAVLLGLQAAPAGRARRDTASGHGGARGAGRNLRCLCRAESRPPVSGVQMMVASVERCA